MVMWSELATNAAEILDPFDVQLERRRSGVLA
jgi:hypothetical protein